MVNELNLHVNKTNMKGFALVLALKLFDLTFLNSRFRSEKRVS